MMFEGIYFESDRLKTCELNKEDAISLFQMYSDREAMKYRGSKAMESMEDAHVMIDNQFTVNNQISKLRMGIRHKSSSDLIGTLLLVWDENVRHQCEIGFSFGRKFWNNGYGKETFQMVEQKLCEHDDIEEIMAWCNSENFVSIRIFEKADFTMVEQNQYPQSIQFLKRIKP